MQAEKCSRSALPRYNNHQIKKGQVRLFLQVTNKNTTKNLNFSPMALIKIIDKGKNNGDLNPKRSN